MQTQILKETKEKNEHMEQLADHYLNFLREELNSEIMYHSKMKLFWIYNPDTGAWNKYEIDLKSTNELMYSRLFNYLRAKNLFENRYTNTSRVHQEVLKLATILTNERKLAPELADDRYHNFTNGILDTKEKKFLEHTPKIFTDYQYPFEFDTNKEFKLSDYPNFEKLITGSLTEDGNGICEDMETMVQQAFGTMLSPIKYPVMYIFTGVQNSAKSTFMELLRGFVGMDRSGAMALEKIAGKKSTTFSLYEALMGNKLNISEEIEGDQINAGTLKTLISENVSNVEGKGTNAIKNVQFNTRFFGVTNNVLEFKDGTEGIDRRVKYINFTHSIPAKDVDETLVQRIVEKEMEGVVAWAYQGLLSIEGNKQKEGEQWFNGFFQSESSLDIRKEVANKSRPVYDFLEQIELARTDDEGSHIDTKALRIAFADWAEEEGAVQSAGMKQTTFGSQFREYVTKKLGMTSKEYDKLKRRIDNNTKTVVFGLTLTTAYVEPFMSAGEDKPLLNNDVPF